jgi:hypothetical protein
MAIRLGPRTIKAFAVKAVAVMAVIAAPLALHVEAAGASPLLVNPTITSSATASAFVNTAVSDSATFSGSAGTPTGIAEFEAFGPTDPTCAAAAVFNSGIVNIVGGSASSGPFTPTTGGTYQWEVLYGGDGSYNSFLTTCGASGESTSVLLNNPTITSSATASGFLSTAVSDSATFSGAAGTPTGIAEFQAFGPGDPTCASAAVFNSGIVNIVGGSASSGPFTPTAAGTYTWAVLYGGDSNYNSFQTCGGSGETTTITQATTGTTSLPSATAVVVGTPTTDTATVTGNATLGSPGGTVSFHVCGPLTSASGCATGGTAIGTPVTLVPGVNGTSSATSAQFTPSVTGTYCFRADYGGSPGYTASSDSTTTECFSVFDRIITGSTPGSVVIAPGQSVLIQGATIGGSVSASHAASVTICGSTIAGSVTITNASGAVVVGDPAHGCAVNTIGGSLTLENDVGGVVAKNNTVKGAVITSGNPTQDVSGNHK